MSHAAPEPGKRILHEQYRKHWRLLLQRAEGLLQDSQEAEDVVQDVCVKICSDPVLQNKLATVADPLAYLDRAVRNESCNRRRKRDQQRRGDDARASKVPLQQDAPPWRRLERKDLHRRLAKLEKQLSMAQRRLFKIIRREPELSTRQLGRRLGCSHKNVQALRARIRKRIAEVLDPSG